MTEANSPDEKNIAALMKGNNEFALEMLKKLREDDKNLIF